MKIKNRSFTADQNEAADWESFVAGKNAYEAEVENRIAIKEQLDYLGVYRRRNSCYF